MPRPALPEWSADCRVLSVLVNINLDPIRVPPETMNNRCRKLANKATQSHHAHREEP
ncbi:hypothetical protein ACLB9X_28655 [Streptomyces sp. 5K101]|uniref:hypothetical protein n=1 Tax=Streptomyces sp. 5K101 TaxID=3390037 RepID=UPI003974E6BE